MTPQIRTAGPSAIKILASHSSFTVLDALAPAFERASGQQYAVEADGAKAMFARIKGGETADVVVLGPAEVGELEALGIIAAGSRRLIARSRVGVAEQMKSRIVTRPGGYIARVVAAGEAELAIQVIVELVAVPGVDLVGPLPDEIQQVFETAAGVFAASKQPAAASALIQFLLATANAGVFREKGLEPI